MLYAEHCAVSELGKSCDIVNGYMFGRSLDDKACVAAFAAKMLKDTGIKL